MRQTERDEAMPAMARLRIDLVGKFYASVDGVAVKALTRKSQALLGYLLLSGTPKVPRRKLAELLWGNKDDGQAGASLRQALSEIQRILVRQAGSPHFKTDTLTVSLDVGTIDCDILEAITSARAGIVAPLFLARERVTDLVLEDVEDVNESFADWLAQVREALRAELVSTLSRLLPAEYDIAVGTTAAAAAKAIRYLDFEHEPAVRTLMKAHAAEGNTGTAIALYARLWRHLEDTYDAEPDPLTQALNVQLRPAQPLAHVAAKPSATPLLVGSQPMLAASTDARPSVAILPFRANSPQVDAYLAAGITESVTHALAALKELFVISRGSTLNFASSEPDYLRIGRELGARYLLAGTVQKIGDRLRITAELTETENGTVVHSNQRDGTIADFFDLQDEIAIDMIQFIAPEVRDRELRRSLQKRPQDVTAYDLVLQAYGPLNSLNYADFSRARDLLERAMELDPTYAPAFAYAAWWHSYRIGQEWSPSFADDSQQALSFARKAVQANPKDALALTIHAHQQSFLFSEYSRALADFDQSLRICPNLSLTWTLKAATLNFAGRSHEAIECASTGVRLAPMDSSVFFAEHILAIAYHIAGKFEEASDWSKKSDTRNSCLTSNLRLMIANLSALGCNKDATAVADRLKSLSPNFRAGLWQQRSPLPATTKTLWGAWFRGAGIPD